VEDFCILVITFSNGFSPYVGAPLFSNSAGSAVDGLGRPSSTGESSESLLEVKRLPEKER